MNISDYVLTRTPMIEDNVTLEDAVSVIKENQFEKGIKRIGCFEGTLLYNFNVGLPAFFSNEILREIGQEGNVALTIDIGAQIEMIAEHNSAIYGLWKDLDSRGDRIMVPAMNQAGLGLKKLFWVPEMFCVENAPLFCTLIPTPEEWEKILGPGESMASRGAYFRELLGFSWYTQYGNMVEVTKISETDGPGHHCFIVNPFGMPYLPTVLEIVGPDFRQATETGEAVLQMPDRLTRLHKYGHDWPIDYVERAFQLRSGTFRDRGRWDKTGSDWWEVAGVSSLEILFSPLRWPNYISHIIAEIGLRRH